MTTMAPQKPSQRARTKAGAIQKAPGNGVTKHDITAAKISDAMTKRSPELIQKLEDAFAIDATIPEACMYAGISVSTYHNWTKSDPKLLHRFTELRLKPVLAARQEVVKGIKGDKRFAMEYLVKKKPDEFGASVKVEGTIRHAVVVLPARRVRTEEVITIDGDRAPE